MFIQFGSIIFFVVFVEVNEFGHNKGSKLDDGENLEQSDTSVHVFEITGVKKQVQEVQRIYRCISPSIHGIFLRSKLKENQT